MHWHLVRTVPRLTKTDIYFLTAIGLPPGGSSTVHIYTQTIHRTTHSTQTIHRITQLTNWEECEPCPVFASYTLAFALQPRRKPGKTSVRVAYNNKTHKLMPSAFCWAYIFNCVMHEKWKILRITDILCDISASKLFISYFCICSGPFTVWYLVVLMNHIQLLTL